MQEEFNIKQFYHCKAQSAKRSSREWESSRKYANGDEIVLCFQRNLCCVCLLFETNIFSVYFTKTPMLNMVW